MSNLLWKIVPGLLLVAMFVLGGCSSDESEPISPPVLSNLSLSQGAAGDTLELIGNNFLRPPGDNRVVFAGGASAVPFAGSETRLRIEIPEGSFTGALKVRNSQGTSNGIAFGIFHGVGEVGIFDMFGAEGEVTLLTPTPGTDYLIVPHALSEDSVQYDFAFGVPSGPSPVSREEPSQRDPIHSDSFHRRLREREMDLIDLLKQSPDYVALQGTATTDPAQTRQFLVIKDPLRSTLDPGNFVTVTANLVYPGDRCLIYMDQETPSNSFEVGDTLSLGQAWDNSIYLTNVNAFGGESDVDGNSRVLILLSPAVNRLTPAGSSGLIAGYFLGNDLFSFPIVPDGTSNGAEILYSIVPDPDNLFGNQFTRDQVWETILAVFAHEFQHMIIFNQKGLKFGIREMLWLNEGLSHVAEDLNGFTKDNAGRSRLYLLNPDETALYGARLLNLSERGAAFLFLRYLGDVYGNVIYKKMVTGSRTHKSNVQAAVGVNFNTLFAHWLSTLYLNGRGITSDPRFQYGSLGSEFDFGVLPITSRNFASSSFTGSVLGSSGKFLLYSNSMADTTRLGWTNADSKSALRAVFVRIE